MLRNYAVLRGRAVAARVENTDDSPHYQIHVTASGVHYRVAVNVQSFDHSALLYRADEHFSGDLTAHLASVPTGLTRVKSAPGGLALDYVRAYVVDRAAMRVVPAHRSGPDNDLNERLDHFVQRAIRDQSIELYALGEAWGPETAPDAVYGFMPGRGVHNIHMNQGNADAHRYEDGIWQDGALFIREQQRWIAIFLAFQTQAWSTDDRGHALNRA